MKFIHPNIIFLDTNLDLSAQYLTNKHLDNCIKSCNDVLLSSLFYMIGIRSKKFHKFYFSGDKRKESMDKWFPTYPLKSGPAFIKYNSQEARWCRKCKNHYDYILRYFESLLNEYAYRFHNDHKLYEMLDFFKMIMYEISVKYGIRVVYIRDLKITLPWKSLPVRYRKKNIIEGYRAYYVHQIFDPIGDYMGSSRNVPEFFKLDNDIA